MNQKVTLRKALSKRTRFEIFKRDTFKCQYCGSTPEMDGVILHVDHIQPIANGGTNELTNLITACNVCNLGKKDIPLDDKTALAKSRQQMELLQEKREQLEMMMIWQDELNGLKDELIERLCQYWQERAKGFQVNDNGKRYIQKWLRNFSPEEIINGMEVAFEQYLVFTQEGTVTEKSWEEAFNKIPGICKWEKEFQKDPSLRDLFYIRNIANKRCPRYFDYKVALDFLKAARDSGVSLDELRSISSRVSSWTNFKEEINNAIENGKNKRDCSPEEGESYKSYSITLYEDEADEIEYLAEKLGIDVENFIWREVLDFIGDPRGNLCEKLWLMRGENPKTNQIFFEIKHKKPNLGLCNINYVCCGEFFSFEEISESVLKYCDKIFISRSPNEIEYFNGLEDVVNLTQYLENNWRPGIVMVSIFLKLPAY